MSRNINGVAVIEGEPDFICFLCGKITETRPYGPNGEEICFECGMKDKETTERMMGKTLFGEKMQPFQQRVVSEKTELSDKLERLEAFANGAAFSSVPPDEQTRLTRQLFIMKLYEQVLSERIAAFE